jgi:integrase
LNLVWIENRLWRSPGRAVRDFSGSTGEPVTGWGSPSPSGLTPVKLGTFPGGVGFGRRRFEAARIDPNVLPHLETFAKKKDADARHADVRVNIRAGIHVAPSTSINVKEAAGSWLKSADSHNLERATIKQYREHVEQHIVPFIGTTKVSELNAQIVRKFEDKLREHGRSPAMIRKVLGSLGIAPR